MNKQPGYQSKIGLVFLIVSGCACMGGPSTSGSRFNTTVLKAKRSEVLDNLNELKAAEVKYHATFNEYVGAGSEAEARQSVTVELHPWKGGADWDKLEWRPKDMIRGGYWIERSADGVVLHGVIDADGDGGLAEYKTTLTTDVQLITPPEVY